LNGDAGDLLNVLHSAEVLIHDRDPVDRIAVQSGREALAGVHPPGIGSID